MGGELVTIGSDAHNKNDIASDFDRAQAVIKECGVKYYCLYENRIAEIVGNVETTKQNLIKLVDKRDIEIKNALQKSQTEIDDLNKIIAKLKEENECHKVNLIKIRDEREFFRSKVEVLSKNENDLFNESQIQNGQIQQLKNDNDNLRNENDQLKCELSKLDKLIYGKIRPSFKTNN